MIEDIALENTRGLDRSNPLVWRHALVAAAASEVFEIAAEVRELEFAMRWSREKGTPMSTDQEQSTINILTTLEKQSSVIFDALIREFEKEK